MHKILISTDLVCIHSPSVCGMLTKMGKHPINFLEYTDYHIFRDVLTEKEPNPLKKYYRVYDVLTVLSRAQIPSIRWILETDPVEEEDEEPKPKFLF